MGTSIVVFTRDLRVHDHPALAAAARESKQVVPLFVFDDAVLTSLHRSPNRIGFLIDCLADLDDSLRHVGAGLVLRRGDWVTQVLAMAGACGATAVHVSDDVSGFARARLSRLERDAATARVAVTRHPGVTVVPPEALAPSGGGEFKVFTPYYRRWVELPRRKPAAKVRTLALPSAIDCGLDLLDAIAREHASARSPDMLPGGESHGLERLRAWASRGLASYDDDRDQLGEDATSRLSAYVHLGCLSPGAIDARLRDHPGAPAFLRQLAWRDFYHQVLAARPDASRDDYRSRGDRWERDDEAFDAWASGQTGYPIVDAAMRQLQREGYMHNRSRLIVASFLTKDLYVDWRLGAAHFMRLLIDGDVANNQLNWQWVAGTGNDTNPFRIFNPLLQSKRYDPNGDYIRRYVPELAPLRTSDVHDPTPAQRQELGYVAPIVDHREAVARFRARGR